MHRNHIQSALRNIIIEEINIYYESAQISNEAIETMGNTTQMTHIILFSVFIPIPVVWPRFTWKLKYAIFKSSLIIFIIQNVTMRNYSMIGKDGELCTS